MFWNSEREKNLQLQFWKKAIKFPERISLLICQQDAAKSKNRWRRGTAHWSRSKTKKNPRWRHHMSCNRVPLGFWTLGASESAWSSDFRLFMPFLSICFSMILALRAYESAISFCKATKFCGSQNHSNIVISRIAVRATYELCNIFIHW